MICKKLFNRTNQTVLATAGCMTDVVTLRRMLSARLTQLIFFANYLISVSNNHCIF